MAGKPKREVEERYARYVRRGYVTALTEGQRRVPVKILRDTGADRSLILRRILPSVGTKKGVTLRGVGGMVDAPLIEVTIEVDGGKRQATVGLTEELPIPGIEMILGNDVGGQLTINRFLLPEDNGDRKDEGLPGRGWRGAGSSYISLQVDRSRVVTKSGGEDKAKSTKKMAPEAILLTMHQQKRQQSEYLEEMGKFLSNPQVEVSQGTDQAAVQGVEERVEGVAAVTRAAAKRQREAEREGPSHTMVTGGEGDLFCLPQSEHLVVADPAERGTEERVREPEANGALPTREEDDGRGERRRAELVEGRSEGSPEGDIGSEVLPTTRQQLVVAQREDPELFPLLREAVTREEAEREATCYYLDGDMLKRKWRNPKAPCEEHQTFHQIILPRKYREEVMRMAHEEVAAHLSAKKTGESILNYYFWPRMQCDISSYVKKCEICQKCNPRGPDRVPLRPIPVVGEPFEKIVVDIVGPLPRTRGGNEYLLTLMCVATRYADAIPVSSCKAKKITPKLMDIFSKFGVPKVIQSDRGSNFMGRFFQQALRQLGISHVASSAYHPQSQGCLERFHKTLKETLTKFCHSNSRDWDEGVQVALYAIRTARHEGLGFSPFELLFGRRPRENLRILYEGWEGETEPEPLAEYVTKLRDRMRCAHEIARQNMQIAQDRMKVHYDKRTKIREFKEGELVLLFDEANCRPLQAKYKGPYVVLRRLGPVTYLLSTPGRRQSTRSVHVNLLKRHEGEIAAVAAVGDDNEEMPDQTVPKEEGSDDFSPDKGDPHLANTQAMDGMSEKLSHLRHEERAELIRTLHEFPGIMRNTPTRTQLIQHDVELVDGARPVKQYPYRLPPEKREKMRREVKYLLDNGLARPSCSPWASPCLLVPKEDGTSRLCTDYRRLNLVTVPDAFPMPRIDDLIDEVSSAKFLSKVDLLRGFYQVPLSDRAREASAFVTPDGLYEYLVMPFGMKNSGSTFQRMANDLVRDLTGVRVYVDDLVVFSDSWEEHIERLKALFKRLSDANLTVNLPKCDLASSTVSYLGHRVGRGGIRPLEAKVKDILEFEAPKTRR